MRQWADLGSAGPTRTVRVGMQIMGSLAARGGPAFGASR